MKSISYHFNWLEREDGRKRLRASVSRDGKLRLGKGLREKLPRFIRVGFDAEAMALAITEGQEGDVHCVPRPACGIITAQTLSAQISATGLQLPVAFDLSRDEQTGYLVGRTVLRRRKEKTGWGQFDPEQLLVWCGPMLKRAVYQTARSTPLEDRRSIATEALCAAAKDYHSGCGDLERYLEDRVRLALKEENKPFVKDFGQRSLDQPLTNGEEDFCLYDVVAADGGGWMETVEAKVDAERFCGALPPEQRDFIRMLREGFALAEIGELLGTDEGELRRMACEIALRKKQFDEGVKLPPV